MAGDVGDLRDRSVERLSVRLGRLRRPADLPHVLERRGLDLVVGRRRLEIVKGVDVPAHAGMVAPAHARIQR